MTVVRSHLLRYTVTGYDPDGKKFTEYLTNGRDAYIMDNYLRRIGYTDVTIRVFK